MQQSICGYGCLGTDMFGKLEATFKGTAGDTTMQELTGVFFVSLLAGNNKLPNLCFDVQLILAKPGNGQGNAIGILAGFFDIVRG